MNPVKLLSVSEVAAELDICSATVYRLVRRNELRALHVGKLLRFRRADLDAYLERTAQRLKLRRTI